MKQQNKGLTLVALVITVIVLIILAGVSINAIMTDGIVENAKNAKDKWASKSAEEELGLSEIKGLLAEETLGKIYAGESAGETNKKYVQGGKTAIIPAGFTVSNITGENTISGGLVIYSMDETTAAGVNWNTGIDESGNVIQEKYNQYVWIPVEKPSEELYGILESPVKGREGIKFGKAYFGKYTTSNSWVNDYSPSSHTNWPGEANYDYSSVREPAVLAEYSTQDSELHLGDEFSNMIRSVEKYKGFYMGRYELTVTNETTPTVLKNADPMLQLSWYNLYNACTNLEVENENAKDKVRTTMIWGCQWDQAVKRCLKFDSSYLTTNSKKYGVYTDSSTTAKGQTGRMNAAYNIYDMGGNVYDLTLEACDEIYRVVRGGYAGNASTAKPAMSRDKCKPTLETSVNIGCRAQLYIK